ncbi:MAG: hypothetical protein D6811_03265 [Alphaproteobacteria bacterium]|nr:MAG: hypothetical protein D6811_03265 [Alphaproteobacteria bacterium]
MPRPSFKENGMAIETKVLGFEQRVNPRTGDLEDWVILAPPDGAMLARTPLRIREVMPKERGYDRDQEGLRAAYHHARWEVIEPLYRAWKDGVDMPQTGTPLAAWAGVTKPQADELARHGVRTVEDLAGLTDGAFERIKLPDTRRLRDAARAWLTNREGGKMAGELAETKEKLAATEEALAEILERMRALEQQPPRKRGRPRKEAAPDMDEVDAA